MSNALPDVIDCRRKRGDTFPLVLNIKDSAGVAIDITGFTYQLVVDPDPAPVNSLNNLFIVVGSVTNGPGGVVEFAIDTGNEDNLGNFRYEVEQTDGTTIKTILEGSLIFVQDVAK